LKGTEVMHHTHRLEMWRLKTEKKIGGLKKRHWCHLIGLDSLFQKTPIITPK
jgi:hypothetical protein